MKNQDNIFDLLDQIPGIEPSTEWDSRLWQKMNHATYAKKEAITGRFILAAIAIILLINAFSFSKNFISGSEQENVNAFQNIATEYLISTSSSKY